MLCCSFEEVFEVFDVSLLKSGDFFCLWLSSRVSLKGLCIVFFSRLLNSTCQKPSLFPKRKQKEPAAFFVK